MTLKNLQEEVDKWAQQFKKPYWEPLSQMARLTEETGEVAREMNHLFGDKKKRSDEETKGLGQELADVIFTICCIANSERINLEEEWNRMMEKITSRDKDRHIKK